MTEVIYLLDEVVEKPNDSSLSRTMVKLWPNISSFQLHVIFCGIGGTNSCMMSILLYEANLNWLEISRHRSFKDVIQQKCTMTVLEDIK
jgi:hypothetical protein